MCGRFGLSTPAEQLKLRFGFGWSQTQLTWKPRYNIAPTQEVLAVVRKDRALHGGLVRWGLVPSFSRGTAVGSRMINARVETLGEKHAFRDLIARRRCLVLADGFFEWRKEPGGGKTPMWIHLAGGEPFAFAGLWDVWRSREAERIGTCTILTTTANEVIAPIHDRMPVILDRDGEERWLDPRVQELAALRKWLEPYPAGQLEAYPVLPLVNSVANDMPECLTRVG